MTKCRKEMSKLFFENYRYDMVKCRRNVSFEGMDTECSTGKNDRFDYCEEYLRSTSNKILSWQC